MTFVTTIRFIAASQSATRATKLPIQLYSALAVRFGLVIIAQSAKEPGTVFQHIGDIGRFLGFFGLG